MKRTRLLSVLLAALFCAGCSTLPSSFTDSSVDDDPRPTTSQTSPVIGPLTDFAVCFSPSDVLNPFRASTRVNRELSFLLYEGLTALDADWEAQPALASSVEQTDDTHLRVSLRADARFSDGTAVTAADVEASFAAARKADAYAVLLENVRSVTAAEDGALIVTLESPDPQAECCLSFPVVPAADVAADTPRGSGPYRPADGDRLVVNPYYPTAPAITEIGLSNLSRNDDMLYGLESGDIAYFFNDLSDGEVVRTVSTLTGSVAVPMNYLVFLGINSNKAPLSDARLRTALSGAIDRETLCGTAFSGYAQSAVTPFHPQWKQAAELSGFSADENISQTVAQLKELGYNTDGSEGTAAGQTLTLELLVGSGNAFREAAAVQIAAQLQKVGITVTVTTLPYETLLSRLKRGEFELYLGEIRLSADKSLRPLLTRGGAAAYGVPAASMEAYEAYLSGASSLSQFVAAFTEQAPFLPLCWRMGIAAYHRGVSGISPTGLNPYYGITGWSLS